MRKLHDRLAQRGVRRPHTLHGQIRSALIHESLVVVTCGITVGFLISRLVGPRPEPAVMIAAMLFTAIVSVSAGVATGQWVTRGLAEPVVRLVDHVRTQGYLAVEGAPYAGQPCDDVALPIELRELGAVVDDLLRHLAERQAELKSAVRDARYAEETLSVVVSESLEGKLLFRDGKIIVANPAAGVALGRPAADLIGLAPVDMLREGQATDEDDLPVSPAEILSAGLEGPVTVKFANEGQPPRWYTYQAVRHADDLHNRILVSFRDITEERRVQQVRNEIVALVSHDLRSPLAVIVGYLELLQRPMSEEDHSRALVAAKHSAGVMADLLEDLLSAARAEELLAPSSFADVSLVDLAEDVVSSMTPTHTDRLFDVVAECHPIVSGDESRLRQALVNLVTNAFKYSPPGSPVFVRVACHEGRALLAVEDHGIGVPSADRERIFDRFARLDRDSEHYTGVGLGLYIVRAIAESHGGRAYVEDGPGGGGRFVIEFPARSGCEPPPVATPYARARRSES